ncbi:MAG: nickel pincer cofactor biosynthesis protein LarB [Candidatus Thermoplasmatota archaeon]|nr:nickel pincer cofactor biosynthesis protein LarB [Candidatus Thermoplasmatota archaeon]
MKKLLQDYKAGRVGLSVVLQKLRSLPYEDLEFAKIDTHREIRKGFPETVFCLGKTIAQISQILKKLDKDQNILLTKANKSVYAAVRKLYPTAQYNESARTVVIQRYTPKKKKGKILVLTAGTSDIPVAEEAVVTAQLMGNTVEKVFDVGVAGVHRLFDIKEKIFHAEVIIVIAGMEGALASIVGGLASKPVIAVPTSVGYGASFQGIAPLLTMLNCCAEGVVVVNIDNGFGAGYFASLINR